MDALHVCLNVADADQAANWYVDQLGFERTWEFTTADGGTRNTYVADGNGFELQLSDTEDQSPAPGTAWDHLAVHVEDVDDAFEDIENYGVVQAPADNDEAGARTAFIEDPDGHVVELVTPLE
jgi:lactoylglutathione lyase